MNALESLTTLRFPAVSPRSRLESLLSHFADVRAGEGVGILLMALNLFLLLGAYYLLKTVREVLILTQGGAEVKSYSSAGQAALLLVLVPLSLAPVDAGAKAQHCCRRHLHQWRQPPPYSG